jgi:AcrR family transcriptional regulator
MIMEKAPRTRNPDAKRAALHEAAFALLASQPYASVSVAMIAARAGIAVGSVYRFYPTKMALLEALSDALEGQFVAAMQGAWESGGPYPDRIARLATALFGVIAARQSEITVMQITAGHRSAGSRPMGDLVRREIARLYADGIANGGFYRHDPQAFAAAAYGLIEGLMLSYFTAPGPQRQRQHAGLLALMLQKLVARA